MSKTIQSPINNSAQTPTQSPALTCDIGGIKPIKLLTNGQLIRKIEELDARERKLTLATLLHLSELDRRRLYLKQGYTSCFAFCVQHLDYSEAAANRRIRAARCIRDFPNVAQLFDARRISLTTISKIHGIITNRNSDELLKDIEGKTSNEINIIVSRFHPIERIHDKVRPVFVLAAVSDEDVTSDGHISSETGGKFSTAACDGKDPGLSEGPAGSGKINSHNCQLTDPPAEECSGDRKGLKRLTRKLKYKLEFGIDPDLMTKIDKVKKLLSTKYPGNLGLETLFEELVDEYLERHCPEARKLRRTRRIENRKEGANKKSNKGTDNKGPDVTEIESENVIINSTPCPRHIPDRLHDEVFIRDEGKCTFPGPNGHRCNSEWNLQIDHIVPFSCGGTSTLDNLRLLCGKHNRHEAERLLGSKLMKKYINRE